MSDPTHSGSRTRAKARDPESVVDALERARKHAARALSESAQAAHALLDAASLAATGRAARQQPGFDVVAQLLDDATAQLGSFGDGAPDESTRGLHTALCNALDAEIARWEARANRDVEARAVLRAFLGLREILWELGIHRAGDGAAPREGTSATRRRSGAKRPAPSKRARGSARSRAASAAEEPRQGPAAQQEAARVQRIVVES